MRQMKKIFCIVMTIAFVLTFVSPASTADAATKSITEGEWLNAYSGEDYYEIEITGAGYLTLTSKTDNEGYIPYYEILNSKKKTFSDDSFVSDEEPIDVIVSSGTYYIHYFGEESDDTACVKYTFTPIKDKKNYCKAKAISLKAGNKVKIYQIPKRGFNRYFKIKLGSKKKITVYSECNIDIFNAKGKDLDVSSAFAEDDIGFNGLKYRTKKKLPKGTYYIVVRVDNPFKSAIDTVWWQ